MRSNDSCDTFVVMEKKKTRARIRQFDMYPCPSTAVTPAARQNSHARMQKHRCSRSPTKSTMEKKRKRKESTNYRESPRLAELKKTSQAPVHASSRPLLPITCFRLGQIHRFICLSVVSVGKIRSILAPLSMYTYIHVNLAASQ
jgi:hypothetical protein